MDLVKEFSDTQFLNELAAIIPAEVQLEDIRDKLAECAIWHEFSLSEMPEDRRNKTEARQQLLKLASSIDIVKVALDDLNSAANKALDRQSEMHFRRKRIETEVGPPFNVCRRQIDELAEILAASRVALGPARPGQPKSYAPEIVYELAELWQMWTGVWPTLITNTITYEKHGPFKDFCALIIPLIYKARGEKQPSLDNAIKEALYPSKTKDLDEGE